jgi:hypothetical protein
MGVDKETQLAANRKRASTRHKRRALTNQYAALCYQLETGKPLRPGSKYDYAEFDKWLAAKVAATETALDAREVG